MRDKILAALREGLADDVADDEWDEPPQLAVIIHGSDGEPGFVPLEVMPDIWGAAPVHQVLWALTQTVRAFGAGIPLSGAESERVLGVALFSEGWGVSAQATSEDYAAIQAYMEAGGKLADHPAGVECKMVNAVLVEGEPLMVTYFRNGEFVDPDAGEVQGRIPDGLAELLAALQGEKV